MSGKCGDEICGRCGLTYEGHISNTGCVHPCWTPSGKFKVEKVATARPAPTPPIPPGERLSEAEREALKYFDAEMLDGLRAAHFQWTADRAEILCNAVRRLSGRQDSAGVGAAADFAHTLLAEFKWAIDCTEKAGSNDLAMDYVRDWHKRLAAALLATPSDSGGEGPTYDGGDRAMLMDVHNQLQSQAHVCPRCGYEDECKTMDVATELADYLAATPPTDATPTREITGSVSPVMEDARATTPTMQDAATPSAGDAEALHQAHVGLAVAMVNAKVPMPAQLAVGTLLGVLTGRQMHPRDVAEALDLAAEMAALTRPQGAATLAVDAELREAMARGIEAMTRCQREAGGHLWRPYIARLTAALNPSQAGGRS